MKFQNNKTLKFTHTAYRLWFLKNSYVIWGITICVAIALSFVIMAGLRLPLPIIILAVFLEAIIFLGRLIYVNTYQGRYYSNYKAKRKDFPEIMTF